MAVGQTEGHSFKRKGGVLQSESEILRVPIQCKHLGVGDKCPISDMETREMKNKWANSDKTKWHITGWCPIEIKTKIRYLKICCYLNCIHTNFRKSKHVMVTT